MISVGCVAVWVAFLNAIFQYLRDQDHAYKSHKKKERINSFK